MATDDFEELRQQLEDARREVEYAKREVEGAKSRAQKRWTEAREANRRAERAEKAANEAMFFRDNAQQKHVREMAVHLGTIEQLKASNIKEKQEREKHRLEKEKEREQKLTAQAAFTIQSQKLGKDLAQQKEELTKQLQQDVHNHKQMWENEIKQSYSAIFNKTLQDKNRAEQAWRAAENSKSEAQEEVKQVRALARAQSEGFEHKLADMTQQNVNLTKQVEYYKNIKASLGQGAGQTDAQAESTNVNGSIRDVSTPSQKRKMENARTPGQKSGPVTRPTALANNVIRNPLADTVSHFGAHVLHNGQHGIQQSQQIAQGAQDDKSGHERQQVSSSFSTPSIMSPTGPWLDVNPRSHSDTFRCAAAAFGPQRSGNVPVAPMFLSGYSTSGDGATAPSQGTRHNDLDMQQRAQNAEWNSDQANHLQPPLGGGGRSPSPYGQQPSGYATPTTQAGQQHSRDTSPLAQNQDPHNQDQLRSPQPSPTFSPKRARTPQSPPPRKVVCKNCWTHRWEADCDNNEPCNNCVITGKPCERYKCDNFEDPIGSCNKKECRNAHSSENYTKFTDAQPRRSVRLPEVPNNPSPATWRLGDDGEYIKPTEGASSTGLSNEEEAGNGE